MEFCSKSEHFQRQERRGTDVEEPHPVMQVHTTTWPCNKTQYQGLSQFTRTVKMERGELGGS